jgi:MFS family permease
MMKTSKSRAIGLVVAQSINQTVVCAISMMVTTILVLIADAVHATTEQTVLIMTFTSLGNVIGYAITGGLIEKVNPKLLGFLGSLTILIHGYALATTSSIYVLYITSMIYAMALPIEYMTICQTMLTQWVNRGRGFIMTLPTSIYSLISIFVIPLLVNLVNDHGRGVILPISIVGFALVAACSLIFFQRPPEAYGMEPADFAEKKKKSHNVIPDQPYESAMPAKHVFKVGAFYLLISVPLLAAFGYMMYYSNISFILTANNLDVTQIAVTTSVLSVGSMVMAPLFGALCDRIGLKKSYSLFVLPLIAGMIVIIVFKSFIGACVGMFLMSTINSLGYFYAFAATKLFGVNKVGQVVAWGNMIAGIPAMFSGVICAAIATASGGYTLPIIIAIGLLVIDIFLCNTCLSNKVAERVRQIDKPFMEKKLAAEAAAAEASSVSPENEPVGEADAIPVEEPAAISEKVPEK